MITITPTAALHSHHCSPIIPDHVRPARSIPALPSSTVARAHVGSHFRYPGSSTWSRDNRTTTHHEGRLAGRPPRQWTWALGVPTPVSCYSGFIYIIDV